MILGATLAGSESRMAIDFASVFDRQLVKDGIDFAHYQHYQDYLDYQWF